tara:strand:- start:93 stop:437 length:345 start_codon:yes stop_codon:yes gene_type:complete
LRETPSKIHKIIWGLLALVLGGGVALARATTGVYFFIGADSSVKQPDDSNGKPVALSLGHPLTWRDALTKFVPKVDRLLKFPCLEGGIYNDYGHHRKTQKVDPAWTYLFFWRVW